MRVVLLAGGKGSQLWPLSTDKRPKQFCKLFSNKTLLEETYERVKSLGEVSVIAPRNYLILARKILGSHANYIEEPEARGTAHAIRFAAQHFQPEESLIFFPCDHYIEKMDPLVQAIKEAKSFVEQGKIATFGITPKGPETRFGYIEMAEENRISHFYEKPTLEKARALLKKGNIYWNLGIFFFQAQSLLEEWEKLSPIQSPLFDRAIMERTTRGVVFPISLHWVDIGSWSSLASLLSRKKG